MLLQKLLHAYRLWRYKRLIAQRKFHTKTVTEIFTETYRQRYWKSNESVSGQGAEWSQTAQIRTKLPALFNQYGIQSLLDLPCGDLNWMKHLELPGIHYLGGDIVRELIAQNQLKYEHAHRLFLELDLLTDALPAVDCVLVRDALVHFSMGHIKQALTNIKRSPIRYLLTTSFPDLKQNEDIQTGFWRPINLQIAPFYFPEPLVCLNEGCTEAGGAFSDKSLCLWEIAHLPGDN